MFALFSSGLGVQPPAPENNVATDPDHTAHGAHDCTHDGETTLARLFDH
jgi:hypothetical protein